MYTGITNDLPKRVEAHQSGTGARYTRVRRPLEVVYEEPSKNRSTASKREAAIKRLSRSAKLSLVARHTEAR